MYKCMPNPPELLDRYKQTWLGHKMEVMRTVRAASIALGVLHHQHANKVGPVTCLWFPCPCAGMSAQLIIYRNKFTMRFLINYVTPTV